MHGMKATVLFLFLLVIVARLMLRWLNLSHLRRYGSRVPEEFAAVVDGDTLREAAEYTVARDRLGLVENLIGNLLVLLFFFGGLLTFYDQWISGIDGSFLLKGWLFFGGLFFLQYLLDMPFSLYRTFVLESRFGFNTMSFRLWCSDQVKSLLVGMILLSVLIVGALALVKTSPAWWWLWVWLFFALVTLFLIFLSPNLIEPLFYKFQPVEKDDLREKIRELMARAGLTVTRVLQVDASRRTKHANAYFTGIGRVKRIVLFDTLLEEMTDREILGVLAHEAGHWRLGHLWKRLLTVEMAALAVSLSAFLLVGGAESGTLLWLTPSSFFARLTLVGFLLALAAFPLTPVSSWISRRHETAADRFAADLTGDAAGLAHGLVKLAKENLANLHPHPVYAWFYFSHPPVVDRVRGLIKNGSVDEGRTKFIKNSNSQG